MIDLIKQRLKSKTYLTAITLALISGLEMNYQFVSMYLPAEYRQLLLFVWPLSMLLLREVTTKALAEK